MNNITEPDLTAIPTLETDHYKLTGMTHQHVNELFVMMSEIDSSHLIP